MFSARWSARVGICVTLVVFWAAGTAAEVPAPLDVKSVPQTADDRATSNASPLGAGEVMHRVGHDQKTISTRSIET